MRINVLYWKEKVPGRYGADRFPVFLQENAVDNHAVYGLPSEEYPGLVKVSVHQEYSGLVKVSVHQENPDWSR